MIPPLTPFMHGVLVGLEAMEYTMPVLAPEEYRSNSIELMRFNNGLSVGYRLYAILNG